MVPAEGEELNHDHVRGRARFAGLVKRYHEWPTSRQQNVAEHSWHVARIFIRIFPLQVTESVLTYALFHDTGELGNGDLPFPVKRDNPDLKRIMDSLEYETHAKIGIALPELSAWEIKALKVCDLMEMYEFGKEELARGCTFGEPVCDVTKTAILEMIQDGTFSIAEKQRILNYLQEEANL